MGDSTQRAGLSFDAPRAVMACAPLLGLAAFAVIRWVDWGDSREAQARGGDLELAAWQFLVSASVVVWALLAAVGLGLLKDVSERGGGPTQRERSWRETVVFVAFVYLVIVSMLVVGAIAGLRNPYVMDGQAWKILVLHLVAGVANVPLLVVLKRIQIDAADDTRWSITARDVERLRVLRGTMQAAIASLGVVIALAVIATGALRQATVAAGLTPVPDTFVLIYGAQFTGVVAAIYLYVFSALEARGRWMLQTAAPLPDPDPGSAEAFMASRRLRTELAQELELGGDPRRNLEGLIAVLAPLAGALLTRIGGL